MDTVKTAYNTKELSQLLGATVRGINYRAKREGWVSRQRPGRGGGHEWLVASMPEGTRLAVTQAAVSRMAQLAPTLPALEGSSLFTVNTLETVPEAKRQRAGARALLVRLAQEFCMGTGKARTPAYELFCHIYNTEPGRVPAWVLKFVPKLCRASLSNWEKSIEHQGLAALAGKHGQHRIGKGVIDSTPGMADLIIGHMVKFAGVSAKSVMEGLEVRFAPQELPHMRNLQRWMKQYREQNAQVLLKIQNPDGWRSKYQSAAGSRSEGITGIINRLWEMDSSPADVLLKDGKRYTVIGCIDVGTRRARLHVARTSSAEGVCAVLRRALLDFGISPSLTIKMDNGSDYTSDQVTTVIYELRITPCYCTKCTPEEKPHIERFFKTFQHRLEKLPGFIGHSVADRKAIESRKSFAQRVSGKAKESERDVYELAYTLEEFQRYCDVWCRDVYGEEVHSELGMAPNEAAAQAEGHVVRIENERALDLLLMPIAGKRGIRRVTKKGLRVGNGAYNAKHLGGLEGQDVQVRMDRENSGYIYVFDLNGIFICKAEDPALTGISRRELALARRQYQKAVLGEKTKEARRIARKTRPEELVPLFLAMKEAQGEAKREERAALYGEAPAQGYTTPALEQAARAATTREAYKPAPLSAADMAEREAFATRHKAEKHTNTLDDLSTKICFWVALQLEGKLADRKKLSPQETKWLFGYQSTSYYTGWRRHYTVLGDGLFDGLDLQQEFAF